MSVILVMFNIIISTVPVAFMCLIFWFFWKLTVQKISLHLILCKFISHEVIHVCLSCSWKGDMCSSKNSIQRLSSIFMYVFYELNYMYFRRRQRRTWQTECRPLWRRETSTGSRYSKRRRITTQNSYRPRQGDFIILNMDWLRQSYKIQELW